MNVSSNWLAGAVVTNFLTYDKVVFDDSSTNWNPILAGTLAPGSISVNSTNSYTFSGTGSISGTVGTAAQSAYCASKWGVTGLVKSLAEELRGSGVQALCVLPGSVDTDMLAGSGYEPEMTAADVAGLIAYAGLDAPAAMNGSAVEMFGA